MKKFLYVVIVLGLLYIVLCLFGPSKIKVERKADVKAPSSVVLEKLLDLEFFHSKWSPWTELDPNMKVEFTGEKGKPGSGYNWVSDKDDVGKGSMTLERITTDSIVQTLRFEGMGESKVYFLLKSKGEETEVTWGMTFDIGFFGRAPMLFMNMDKMLGDDYEKGLAKFQIVMAGIKSETTASYDILETTWEERTYLGKKGLVKFEEMPTYFINIHTKLMDFLQKNNIEILGPPSGIYFTYDEEKKESECAPVFFIKDNNKKMEDWDRIKIPASKVLLIEYFGSPGKSMNAHIAMDTYMKQQGLSQSFVIEEYITNPMVEKDTSKWQTNIYYVLKK